MPSDITIRVLPHLDYEQKPTGYVFASVCLKDPKTSSLVEVHETRHVTRDETAYRYAEQWINSPTGAKAIALERKLLGLDKPGEQR